MRRSAEKIRINSCYVRRKVCVSKGVPLPVSADSDLSFVDHAGLQEEALVDELFPALIKVFCLMLRET